MEKRRILNQRLAAVVATLRHGEMIFIADAGSGVGEKAMYPLDPSVELIDLGAVTGEPSFEGVVRTLAEAGDFEGCIVPFGTKMVNEDVYGVLEDVFGEEKIREINYAPEFYDLRNRCTAVVQTGDYGIGALAILIAGYPSADIDMKVLTGEHKLVSNEKGMTTMPVDEFNKKYRDK